MDLLNVNTTGLLVASVNSSTNTSTATVDGASFSSQLVQVVNGQTSLGNDKLANEGSAMLTQMVSSIPLLSNEELTSEQLDQLIENLLDQLDELEVDNLDHEQLSLLDQLLQQLAAFVQVISIQNDQRALPQENVLLLQSSSTATTTSEHSIITKLQDQLLLLQQALQEGTLKVVQGKQPELLLTQQLQQLQANINKLAAEISNKGGAEAQASANVFELVKTEEDALSHLQKLAQQVMTNTTSSTQGEANSHIQVEDQSSQPTTAISLMRADNVKDFLPQLAKAPTAAPSAFVLASEFAETMKGLIVQKFDITALNGVTEARLMLTPENLGHVDVKISMQNGILTAIFQAETAMGKDALENQMASLRASLAAQGITVEKIEVAQAAFSAQLSQQQKQNNQQHLQNQQGNNTHDDENSFEEELVTNASHRELGFGRAVNETA